MVCIWSAGKTSQRQYNIDANVANDFNYQQGDPWYQLITLILVAHVSLLHIASLMKHNTDNLYTSRRLHYNHDTYVCMYGDFYLKHSLKINNFNVTLYVLTFDRTMA